MLMHRLLPEKNLAALRTKNPSLAATLEQHVVNFQNMELAETKDGVQTLRYRHANGDREQHTWVHSRYHPLQEAARFAERLANESTIMLYGFGLGYQVRELTARLSQNQRLHILECNMDLLHTAFSLTDFSAIILMDNVTFLHADSPIDALSIIAMAESQNASLAIYKPALNCLDNAYEDLKLHLTRQLIPGRNEIRQKLAAANHHANMGVQSNPIQQLFSRHLGETAVIVSSGPSLNIVKAALKTLPENIVVLCAGSALRPLMESGIRVNYIVVMDALPNVRKQLKGFEQLDIPLLFSNFTCADAIKAYTGPKYMYLCETIPGFPEVQAISSGGSVATAAVAIALKMGIKRMIFAGQDLCFVDEHHHAEGAWHQQSTRTRDLANYIRVRNVKTQWVSTSPKLLAYRKWLENTIAEQRTTVTFYNIAEQGLPIAGAEHLNANQLHQIINGCT
ncbi:MAG: motility associated factor glycosyltransferase family protein [Deltaproteobacteria bacterium]|nr:motility associated factor glycosyltransferase family protein [Deltaproteobacteria bacterium]